MIGTIKSVAMSRFSFKKVNDSVKAEDKDEWRERDHLGRHHIS